MSEPKRQPPVSFEDYAFVTTGVSAGVPLEALLETRQVDPPKWPDAEVYWLDELMGDLLEGEGKLTLRLGELQAEARRSLARPVPPLDEDLAAWVHWSRDFQSQSAPREWLAEQGLTFFDWLHLQDVWQQRLLADEALRQRQSSLQQGPFEPVTVPPPPARTLGRTEITEANVEGTQFGRVLSDEDLDGAMPFLDAQEGEAFREAPDLLQPLPAAPPEAEGVDGTAAFSLDALGTSLPFFAAGDLQAAERPEPPTAPPTPPPAARQPISPPPPSSIVAPPIPSGYLPQPPASPPSAHPIGATAVGGIPALPDEALPFDDRAPAVAPPPSVVPVPHPMAGATSFVPSLSNADLGASVDVTMPPSVRPDARQLPFVGSREAPPSQAPPLDPAPSVGATAFVSISELDLASALPFGDAARGAIDVTAAGGIPALEDPIPFDGTGSAPPPAPEAVAPRVTSGTAVAKATSSAPLPFVAAASTEPPLLPGGLTLRQLASLTVEMELSFARMNELFAAYGLTMATYQAHKKAVAELVARDPSAQVRWNEATHAYRHWRTGR